MSETYQHITPAGQAYIDASPALQAAIERFWESPRPEDMIGGEFVGSERYSSVTRIGGLAIKVSSPTSSEDAYQSGEPTTPENLVVQFGVMTKLREHLAVADPSIVVPEQFFVLRSRYRGYLLGMTHMQGWTAYRYWMPRHFSDSPDGVEASKPFSDQIRHRIRRAMAVSPLRHSLNDLNISGPKLHGGNILLPADATPSDTTPLCIIDQPGIKKSRSAHALQTPVKQ